MLRKMFSLDFKFLKKRDRVPPDYHIHAQQTSALPPACPLYGTHQPTPNEGQSHIIHIVMQYYSLLYYIVLSSSVLVPNMTLTPVSGTKPRPEDTPSLLVNNQSDYSRHSLTTPTSIEAPRSSGPSELHVAARYSLYIN